MFVYSVSPSSGFQPASPLKGEAVRRVKLTQVTASPLRGEAARRADEGGKNSRVAKFQNQQKSTPATYSTSPVTHHPSGSKYLCYSILQLYNFFLPKTQFY